MSEFEVNTNGISAVADKSSVDAGSAPDGVVVDAQDLPASASSTTPPVRQSPIASPCRFFMMGTCRHGSECRFSHDPALFAQNAPPTPQFYGNLQAAQGGQKSPPFIIVQPPPGHPIFSIDVECVATGVQHNARSIAQVALGKSFFSSFQIPFLFVSLIAIYLHSCTYVLNPQSTNGRGQFSMFSFASKFLSFPTSHRSQA